MDKTIQKKRKGGAEKERDRKKKKLAISASQCRKLVDLLKVQDSIPITAAGCSNEVSKCEVKHDQSVAESSASETLDDQLSAEPIAGPSGKMAETEEHVKSCKSPERRDVQAPSAAVLADDGHPLINCFKKPRGDEECLLFWEYHPYQKTDNTVVKRSFTRKDGTNRWWLSYNKAKHSLHCSVCTAFSNTSV